MTIEELYRDLHAHPELSFEETRTAAIAAVELRSAGFDVIEGIGITGVAGVLRNGDGPTVLLRADMDALPVTEDTGLAYASTVPGIMHACGHDVHVTCLIGAIRELATTRAEWVGTVVAVFQPAEEAGGGAQAMLDAGLYEKVPVPDVVLGQHVGPAPAGMLGAHSGAAFASADSIDITVRGRGGHGSRPETTIDPIVIAAAVVGRLQTIVSREIAAQDTSVVTVGRMSAGTKNNIIPETAELGLSIRAYSEEVRLRMIAAIERIVRAESAASGAPEPVVEFAESFPVTVNDGDATGRTMAAFRSAFGEEAVIDPGPVSGSEDVGLLATAAGAPLVYWILGGAHPEKYLAAANAGTIDRDIPSNHSPSFAPEIQPTLDRGVAALVTACREWLRS
ncbi:hippurate hydrolase [Arthrobacter alpinus]|uniref:Hippurate hydrolase n=1 Tax=Arthrobacter alpinus TaxID=656366 RepID=A0A1H5IRY0_9MICC|nr:amidohydrolase [Arthrobacter alpinus]SEE42914.1 hippurate hydrolase [Arthrobacter alpinus]